jgi:hypothetical protein
MQLISITNLKAILRVKSSQNFRFIIYILKACIILIQYVYAFYLYIFSIIMHMQIFFKITI